MSGCKIEKMFGWFHIWECAYVFCVCVYACAEQGSVWATSKAQYEPFAIWLTAIFQICLGICTHWITLYHIVLWMNHNTTVLLNVNVIILAGWCSHARCAFRYARLVDRTHFFVFYYKFFLLFSFDKRFMLLNGLNLFHLGVMCFFFTSFLCIDMMFASICHCSTKISFIFQVNLTIESIYWEQIESILMLIWWNNKLIMNK